MMCAILHVGVLDDAVDVGHQSRLGGDHLGDRGLAAGVRVPVEVSEHEREVAGVLHDVRMLEPIHEDPLVRHEHVVEDGEGFHVAHAGVRRLQLLPLVT